MFRLKTHRHNMDDSSSGRNSLSDSASLATTSLQSGTSSQSIANDGQVNVYIYVKREFVKFSPELLCEEISTAICRQQGILPTTRLLFGIREYDNNKEALQWMLPGEPLNPNTRYCFRMRFRVPELDRQLVLIDEHSHKYLYYQMRFDLQREHIVEMRYPNYKDEVIGLAVIDMVIDVEKEQRRLQQQSQQQLQQSQESIEKAYKHYLPSRLWRAHLFFVKSKIRSTFRTLRSNPVIVDNLKWHYVHQINYLAPTYLTEQFKAKVKYLPNEETKVDSLVGDSTSSMGGSTRTSTTTLVSGSQATLFTTTTNGHHQRNDSGSNRRRPPPQIPVYVKLAFHDSPEPGLKVARVTSEATLKWMHIANVEEIFTLYKESDHTLRLEIVGFPNGYHMYFDFEYEMKSFISYLCTYTRLTVKWMQDLCATYKTPSLEELDRLYCHGPIGGSYSFIKLREKGDRCGSYIVRQCESEYDTYFIDINTRVVARNNNHESCQTETYKIIRRDREWKLLYNEKEHVFDQLSQLAQFIQAESNDRIRIPPSKYDKPPLLLLCLPKNLQTKKTDAELSEAELQRKRPQIFNPKTDLQWHKESISLSVDGKVVIMKGDWIQQGSFKDVPVTMKMLKYDENNQEFMKLAHSWSLIQSPQFIKLYGLTLSVPYTMVMEFSKFGPLNIFLKQENVHMLCMLEMMHNLVRGIHYLEDNRIRHSFIRCSNLYVTKYDPLSYQLVAKIGDPGFSRPYTEADSPWIPINYYNNLEAAKNDSSTQLWAFATTIWEIFSRGKVPMEYKQRDLIRNRNHDGGILKALEPDQCPPEIYSIIMDGWCDDPDKRFSHHDIFNCLNVIKTRMQNNYAHPDNDPELYGYRIDDNTNHDDASSQVDLHALGLPNGGDHDDQLSGSMIDQRSDILNCLQFRDRTLVLELKHGRVTYREKDEIGQGHYGTVYCGKLVSFYPEHKTEKVAIKKLKTVYITPDFQREIDIMRSLDHINVVKIKEWSERSLSIIMDYFELGSFSVYLSSGKPSLNNDRLMAFALDIANGMNYLSSKGLIHRDLAARNILVARDVEVARETVKISDFGLAQFANAEGYYIGISKRDIPIKWYSPEAIEQGKFSLYSDVWSYGVTLFEMFSRGDTPNLKKDQELTQVEFVNELRKGCRLPKPELCSDFVYNELMLPCWNAIPKSRPNFSVIMKTIQREMGENVSAAQQQQQQQHQQQQMQQKTTNE